MSALLPPTSASPQHALRRPLAAACFILAVGMIAGPVDAGVLARVDQSSQRMRVYVEGALAYDWPVSTARTGYVTPNGRYRVGRMERMWYSHKYHGSPMPYALFFRGGYAIHGTGAVQHLGRRASHGCIRLSPGHARELFALASSYGGAQISIRP
ncbi:L,D-transpeptidase [Methylobacterium sp. BTF04]|uniref:L,D-transpeptidase n=1 Tax=Methylobacterium sp. BTF04 TaxID=2708300 RepID=UPI001FED7BFF|nr:L,D-transpeptidase [Methylobacterium sp. BTF04]